MFPMKILTVDDEVPILNVYREILSPPASVASALTAQALEIFTHEPSPLISPAPRPPRYEVFRATSGEQALEVLLQAISQGERFALAFLDMHMAPGMDGLVTAKKLLALDPDLEIVIVTAYSERSRGEIAEHLGEERFLYLKKPFHADEIRQMAALLTAKWQAQREREQLERDKAIFASNMSHELRHPLQVILGVCNTLLNFPMSEERRQQFIQDIQAEAQRLQRLAENLKLLTSEQPVLKMGAFQAVDLRDLIERLVRLLTPDAEAKGLRLSMELPPALPKVWGEANSLMQVLINLTVNAIHYTEFGEVTLKVEALAAEVQIEVRDTGVGIAPSEQEAIFQKFYRVADQALKVRGHGLGLSIVQELLQAHHSRIVLNSQPGQGSCFAFRLPLAKVSN